MPRLANRTALTVLAAGVVAAVVLHHLAGTTWPVVFPDDVDFLTPAAQLARHGTLATPQLSAPHGMFWVPDLYYLLLAPVLRFAPLAVGTGRWVAFVFVIVAGSGFFVAGRRAGAPPVAAAIVVTLWLVSPRIVIAANIARQEPFVLAFLAWALVATLYDRRVLAVGLAGLAALTHPAGVPLALVVMIANGVRRRPRPATRRLEWALLGLVVSIAAFQVVHLVSHASIAVDQLRFQLDRKAGRSTAIPLPLVLIGFALATAYLVRLKSRIGFAAVVFVELALVGVVIFQVGREIVYEQYGYETAALLAGLAILAAVPLVAPRPQTARLASVLAVALVALVVVPRTTHPRFHEMRFGNDRDEWPSFVADVRAELHRLDAAADGPTTVVFNDVSALPWPLATDRIGHLRLVKETIATRAVVDARYAVVAVSKAIPPTGPMPSGRVITRVVSTHGYFTATFVER